MSTTVYRYDDNHSASEEG